ncbi:GSCOCT00004186001.3-RA-CDS, partial [Cotesia congregata]
MAKSKMSDYRSLYKLTKRLGTVVGVWPYESPSILYLLVPYIPMTLHLIISLLIFSWVREKFPNIGLVSKGLSISTSFVTTILKIASMKINHKELTELHRHLHPYFGKLLKDSRLSNIVLKDVDMFKLVSWSLTICVATCLGSYILLPLSFVIKASVHHIEVAKYPLIYPCNYPWKITSNGIVYQLHFVFETCSGLAMFFVSTSVDILFPFYIFQMIAQFREISYDITHIKNDDKDDENNDDYNKVIEKCVAQYERLMRCKDILEKIWGPIILFSVTTNAIVLCTVLFQISKMRSVTIVQGSLLVAYVGLKLGQTFIYAWSGSCLIEESEVYRDAVYAANWYGKKRLMTSIVMLLTQRPLSLTACNFSIVSVKIFITFLNTAVSYFFLLQTLDDK